MSDKTPLLIDCDHDHVAGALTRFLNDDFDVIEKGTETGKITLKQGKILLKDASGDEKAVPTPVKITTLIKTIEQYFKQETPIIIGPYTLDIAGRALINDDETLYLTEKECDVLAYLDQNRDRGITRNDLLQDVWGYAEGVDTHTIETHIYRLRQKIKEGKASADVLLTGDDGYYLVENS